MAIEGKQYKSLIFSSQANAMSSSKSAIEFLLQMLDIAKALNTVNCHFTITKWMYLLTQSL